MAGLLNRVVRISLALVIVHISSFLKELENLDQKGWTTKRRY